MTTTHTFEKKQTIVKENKYINIIIFKFSFFNNIVLKLCVEGRIYINSNGAQLNVKLENILETLEIFISEYLKALKITKVVF